MSTQSNAPQKERVTYAVPGTTLTIPATVITGRQPGRTLTISAGVHSREYVGVQALTELAALLAPENICGRVILLHSCNYEGLIKRSPDTVPADGGNLNQAFPGDANGSPTKRLAAFLQEQIYPQTDYLIDVHSGGFCEALTPHVYFHGAVAPETCAVSEAMASYADVTAIVRSTAKNGVYSYAGVCGIPAILLERGGSGLWNAQEAAADIRDLQNIMRYLGILADGKKAANRRPLLCDGGYYEGSPASGCWYPAKNVGDTIRKGEVIGEIRNIYGDLLETIQAKADGVILYQTCSLGIEKDSPMTAYGIL